MKTGPLNDWNFVRWFLLGAVAFSVGGASSAAFQMMALPTYFSLHDGLFFGTLVPLTFYTIAKIAARPMAGGPGKSPEKQA